MVHAYVSKNQTLFKRVNVIEQIRTTTTTKEKTTIYLSPAGGRPNTIKTGDVYLKFRKETGQQTRHLATTFGGERFEHFLRSDQPVFQ